MEPKQNGFLVWVSQGLQQVSKCTGGPYDKRKLEEYAEITRTLVFQENARQHERTSWLLQSQGLLFAALAFAWEKAKPVCFVLSVVGILSAISIAFALRRALYAKAAISAEWKHRGQEYEGPRIIGLSSDPLIHHPAIALPYVFILAWIVVIGLRLIT